MRVIFLGDFMLSGDQTNKTLVVSPKLQRQFNDCDFRVATLETAIGEYEDIDPLKTTKSEVAVWSKYRDINKLNVVGINVVSLANNHSCDCGIDSLIQMKNKLQQMGIQAIGAGRNEQEAMQPAILEKNGETFAIIGCCKKDPNALGNLRFATLTEGGLYQLDEKTVIPQIKVLKQQYTYVAVVVHWGVEHRWLPENEDVSFGKQMIDAGADVIIGGHPHHVQPVVSYSQHPIYYSLGNFYFPDFFLDNVSNTFYPSLEEQKNLPAFDWMSPEHRNFPMLYFWKYYGRLSLVACIDTTDGKICDRSLFSIYKKSYLDVSGFPFFHRITLELFSLFVGSNFSKRINVLLWRIHYVCEYKFLAIFVKKYSFFNYLKKHNY